MWLYGMIELFSLSFHNVIVINHDTVTNISSDEALFKDFKDFGAFDLAMYW